MDGQKRIEKEHGADGRNDGRIHQRTHLIIDLWKKVNVRTYIN
jgi:hypothetical protein